MNAPDERVRRTAELLSESERRSRRSLRFAVAALLVVLALAVSVILVSASLISKDASRAAQLHKIATENHQVLVAIQDATDPKRIEASNERVIDLGVTVVNELRAVHGLPPITAAEFLREIADAK